MRLINADLLQEILAKEPMNNRNYRRANEIVVNMPTDYDVDKVVEQIETDESHTFYGCINKRYAIEIAKAGGISDNP